MSIKNTILYGALALAVILFAFNPSTDDFKSKVKDSYNEASGKEQTIIRVIGKFGKLQVSRKSFLIFSIFKSQGKSILGDTKAEYHFGFLGNINTLEKGDMQWLTKGKYSESISIKGEDL